MKRYALLLVVVLVVVLGLTACGGGGGGIGGGSTLLTDKVLASVSMSSGNNQTATVGAQLSAPLIALVLNQEGQPIAGQVVNFVVTAGGGSVFASAVVSDANGLAGEIWTLGHTAGVQMVEVRAVNSAGVATTYATFSATAVAGVVQKFNILSGDGQSAQQLQPLGSPVIAMAADAEGNPVAGVSVSFSANNGGSATPATAVTDASGKAATIWTLGNALGRQMLTVGSSGFTPITVSATSLIASGIPAILNFVTGNFQTAPQAQTLPLPLKVIVLDSYGQPAPGTLVTFTPSDGGLAIPGIATTDASGIATATWTLGPTVGDQALVAQSLGSSSYGLLSQVTFRASATKAAGVTLGVTIAKVAGDQQTVVQHILTTQLFTVVVADASGTPIPNVPVVFSTGGGNPIDPNLPVAFTTGSGNPVSVVTDNNGKASWFGFFHASGAQALIATVNGVSTTFAVNVTPSPHIYDGSYTGVNFTIINGVISGWPFGTPDVRGQISGTLNESTGALTAGYSAGNGGSVTMSGNLVLGPNQQVTGSGTGVMSGNMAGGNGSFPWACNRL